ncbi:MAG TPA: ATP-binding protein [Verrucomicrobiae bacterium]|nr:ATP-binding protein [Verrucomicrobiae bacterium]
MKTLLVLAAHPDFAETIRAGLNPEQYRVVHRADVPEAEPLLAHGLASACILDLELLGVQGIWAIEKLRRHDAQCPVIAYSAGRKSEWEEEAYLHGVTHVLTKPVRIRLLSELLDRLWAAPQRAIQAPARVPVSPPISRTAEPPAPRFVGASQTLGVLRDFSSILMHSLNAELMLKQFLLFLRETLSVNRAAIFLNRPHLPPVEPRSGENSRCLRAVSAIGIAPDLIEHFKLSPDSGIGAQLAGLGRILRRNSDEARADAGTQREFELLGAQIAVPILDRETMVGIAVFDGRVTGESLANDELELIFHLLEQVGLALRNIWLYDQLAANHEMMTGVLRELSSACIVVGRDLKVLHANKAARRHFGRKNQRSGELEFADLPQSLGAKIYQVLHTGAAVGPFKFEPENSPGTVYNVSVVPFQRQDSAVPVSALLTAEDLTQSDQLRRLEIEAANLRLVKSMADRLAHEIGNAMVPLSTHQQLLAEKYRDAEFRKSLDHALTDGVRRVTRLINQMRFLARDGQVELQIFPVEPLIQEAYQEARQHQPVETAQLHCENRGKPAVVTGDRAALKHALAEVMLNALQANPKEPKIDVKLHTEGDNSHRDLRIEVQDNGSGFTTETARQAPLPFFTTRNVGLGLGLTVSRKIIETHHGKLEIVPPQSGKSGVVRISLPVDVGAATVG